MQLKAFSLLLLPALAVAQHPWQGEWGGYTGPHAEQGRRLTIQGCSPALKSISCKFNLSVQRPGGNAGTAGFETLTLQSTTSATATLYGGEGEAPCQLTFNLQDGPKPNIAVTAAGKSCTSYYATGDTFSMAGTYAFRSATLYSGSDLDECFLDTSPARLAICTHLNLAGPEQKWADLADEYPVHPRTSKDQSSYGHVMQMEADLLRTCDFDPNPAACLSAYFTTETKAMQAKQDAYLQGTTDRGDPAEGGTLAQKIAGRYRHREPNGDVQGDHYTTTDTLTIRPVGAASIHFSTELNFFNGHSCSLSGGALYRKDGSFVFDDKPTNAIPDSPTCRLAIIPTATGIAFKDINGGCKPLYCGERGSFGGQDFTYKDRISTATAK